MALSKEVKFRYFVALGVCLAYFTIGYSIGIDGPTLIDLTQWLSISDGEMGAAKLAPAAGYVLGSLGGGYAFKYINRSWSIVALLFLSAIANYFIPIIKHYWAFIFFTFATNTCLMAVDLGCNVWAVDQFKEHNAVPLQVMEFCFSIGVLCASWLAPNFLAVEKQLDLLSNNATSDATFDDRWNETELKTQHVSYASQITRTDTTVSVLFALGSIAMIFNGLYFGGGLWFFSHKAKSEKEEKERREPEEVHLNPVKPDEEDSENKGETMKLIRKYRIWAVFWAVCMLGFHVGLEVIVTQYMTTYYYKSGFDKLRAADFLAWHNLAFNIARFCGIFIAIIIPARLMVLSNCLLYTTCLVAALFIDPVSSPSVSLALVLLLGVGFSSQYAAIYSYVNSHCRITNAIAGWILGGAGLLSGIDPVIVGHWIDNRPIVYLYVSVVHAFVVLISFGAIEITFKCYNSNVDKYYECHKGDKELK